MRVAQLIDSLTVGGAQRLVVTFAQAVRGRGIDLTIITLRPSRFGSLAKELDRLGARVVTFHGGSLVDPLRAIRLVRFLRRGAFDVLFTHLSSSNLLGSIAGRVAGVPTIANLHGIRPPTTTRGVLETWTLRWMATCCVAVGSAVAEAHRERLAGKRCVVIPNPIGETTPLSPEEREAKRRGLAGPNDVMIVSIGMLTPAKGYGNLLSAFSELHRTCPGTVLVIAGDGSLEGELRARIDDLELRDSVHLIGICDDVPGLLAAADLYVSASLREGLPLSVLEAMEAGLPVVATKVGDVPSAVVDGTGILVAAGDPAALADALKGVVANAERARRMGMAAQRHVRERYRVDRWAERQLQLAAEVAQSTDVVRRSVNPDRQP